MATRDVDLITAESFLPSQPREPMRELVMIAALVLTGLALAGSFNNLFRVRRLDQRIREVAREIDKLDRFKEHR